MSDSSDHNEHTQEPQLQQSSIIRGEPQPPTPTADIADAFHLMRNYFDAKFVDLKADLVSEQDTISKKIKDDFDLKFKKESHKIQFRFNEEIVQGLLKLQKLNCIDSSASVLISELLGKLKSRNKLIRIADSSAGGWGTVREYEANEIADNSDDEKKIRQAESRALKISKEKSKHRNTPYNSSNRPARIETAPNPASAGLYVQQHVPTRPQLPVYIPPSPQPFRGGFARREPGQYDICHECKQYGHWRKNCPLLTGAQTSGQTTTPGRPGAHR